MPHPTKGSWLAVALASIFKMRIKDALLGIITGNAIAEAIIITVSMCVVEGVSIELLLIATAAISIGIYTTE